MSVPPARAVSVMSPTHMVLRVVAASAAAAGLLLHVLSLGLTAWAWSVGDATVIGADLAPTGGGEMTGGPVPMVMRVLAWGVGFGALALVIVWRVGHRYPALVAALFLASYSLWGGVAGAVPLRDVTGWLVAVMALDALTHAVGVRFTQLFPRPLRRSDLVSLGPAWARRALMPLLSGLLDPRVFWPVAILLEAGRHLLPSGPAVSGGHVLVWVSMAATYLYASYRRGDAAERQRIFWILEGVVAFVAAQVAFMALWAVDRTGVLSLELPFWISWLWAITAWVTLACFYLAVFHSGALDSALVLRRTTVLSASSAVAIVIFLTLESATEQLLTGLLGIRSGAGAILGGVVAGLTFHPLSVRIDRAIQRWMREQPVAPDSAAEPES